MWNKNETEGKIDEVKGKTKQVIADATNDPDLRPKALTTKRQAKCRAPSARCSARSAKRSKTLARRLKK